MCSAATASVSELNSLCWVESIYPPVHLFLCTQWNKISYSSSITFISNTRITNTVNMIFIILIAFQNFIGSVTPTNPHNTSVSFDEAERAMMHFLHSNKNFLPCQRPLTATFSSQPAYINKKVSTFYISWYCSTSKRLFSSQHISLPYKYCYNESIMHQEIKCISFYQSLNVLQTKKQKSEISAMKSPVIQAQFIKVLIWKK